MVKKYEVDYTSYETGYTAALDTIYAEEGYTVEDYIEDVIKNADDNYSVLLEYGTFELTEIDE